LFFRSAPLGHAFFVKCQAFGKSEGFFYSFEYFISHWKEFDGPKKEDFSYFEGFYMVFAWFGYFNALEGVQRHLGGK